MRRVMMLVLATVFSATLGLTAQQPVDPNRWEPVIQKFEAEDKATPPAKGASCSSARRASCDGPTSPSHSPISK